MISRWFEQGAYAVLVFGVGKPGKRRRRDDQCISGAKEGVWMLGEGDEMGC